MEDAVGRVSFLDYDLGYFDNEGAGWNPAPSEARFRADRRRRRGSLAAVPSVRTGESVNYVSGIRWKPCDRSSPLTVWRRGWDGRFAPGHAAARLRPSNRVLIRNLTRQAK